MMDMLTSFNFDKLQHETMKELDIRDNMMDTENWIVLPESERNLVVANDYDSSYLGGNTDNDHHRFLHSPPRIIDDAENAVMVFQENEDDAPDRTMSYDPPKYIANMHAAPRFGHTNRLGKLASTNPGDAMDYAGGLKQFTLFIIVPFIIWGIILIMFKFVYGIHRIGCSAGGEILDMKQLSKAGISRKIRKKRILRSWRLQTTFLIAGILIPTLSLLMMQSGWSKVQLAWEEVQEIVDDVERLAFRGWNTLDGLNRAKDNLYENRLVQDILDQSDDGLAVPLFSSWCPQARGEERLAFLEGAMSTLETNTQQLIQMFDAYVPKSSNGFGSVTEATQAVDDSIEWFFANDWIWKMYIMSLNVLSMFLVLCCYVFSKNNIIHEPTRYYLTFLVVPMFSIATMLLMMVTASSGIAILMNADFCAGGDDPGSPQGTIRDAILSFQHGSVNSQNNLTGTLGLVYDSFTYYASGCLTEHPLEFLQDYQGQVDQGMAYMVELTDNLPDTPETIEMLNAECGGNVSFLPKTLIELETELLSVQSNLNGMVKLASCHSISPLLRRLTHGAVCSESARGLTWIWACCLVICICCFVMLTTRAALYNSIKKRKPRESKPKRVVEKEFEEYKEFMSEYYEDAPTWKLEQLPKKRIKADILEIDFGSQILPNPTFDTAVTTKPPADEDDGIGLLDSKEVDISQQAGLNLSFDNDADDDESEQELDGILGDEEMLDESSYDSDYESDSDDSDGNESDDGDESALLSFFAETRSILSEAKSAASSAASRTMQKIRKMRPLLGKPKYEEEDDDDENDLVDETFGFENNSLFLPSPPASGRTAEISDGLWNKLVTPPSFMGVRTPTAPQKPFSFLRRTDAPEHELVPLTRTPDASTSLDVHPRRLKLSPFLDPTSPDNNGNAQPPPRRLRPKAFSRLHLGVTTPERSSRPRANSGESDDMSLYVEDAPKPPEKLYRRLPRTSHGSSNSSRNLDTDVHR